MQIALEALTIEGDREKRSSLDGRHGRIQERIGERDRVAHRAANSGMKLAHEGDEHERVPRHPARDSAGLRLYP
jgi:hypothetical protein